MVSRSHFTVSTHDAKLGKTRSEEKMKTWLLSVRKELFLTFQYEFHDLIIIIDECAEHIPSHTLDTLFKQAQRMVQDIYDASALIESATKEGYIKVVQTWKSNSSIMWKTMMHV